MTNYDVIEARRTERMRKARERAIDELLWARLRTRTKAESLQETYNALTFIVGVKTVQTGGVEKTFVF